MSPFSALMIGHIPLELVSIGGLIALCYKWNETNRSAAVMILMAIIANQLLFAANLFLAYSTHNQIELGVPSASEVSRLRFLFSLPQMLLNAAAWALLLGAAFTASRSHEEIVKCAVSRAP